MHELSIGSAVVGTAVRHAAGRPVRTVHLRVGQLRQVVPDSLTFFFELVSRETVCDGARLDVEHVPAVLGCGPCDRTWTIDVPAFRCPACGGADVRVLAGNELEVESIEVEEDIACIA